MRPEGPLKLVGEVRDLQIIDSDGVKCGIADDIELKGEPGRPLGINALLVGPGAYPKSATTLGLRIGRLHLRRSLGEGPME